MNLITMRRRVANTCVVCSLLLACYNTAYAEQEKVISVNRYIAAQIDYASQDLITSEQSNLIYFKALEEDDVLVFDKELEDMMQQLTIEYNKLTIEYNKAIATGGINPEIWKQNKIFINTSSLNDETAQLCKKYGEEYGVDPYLIIALIENESGGNENALSPHSCVGLMQLHSSYFYERCIELGGKSLWNAEDNIRCGTDYLAELTNRYDNDWIKVLGVYNKGPNAGNDDYNYDYINTIIRRTKELNELKIKQLKGD